MPESDVTTAFRAKANLMKTWQPASTPSNRDRLELYALHKVAVSGEAPASIPTNANAAERAKYQAWRSKSGTTQEEAMRLYLQEADRQLRVYGTVNHSNGTTPQTPQTTPNSNAASTTNGGSGSNTASVASTPRGLAAIPLLCAAVAESRSAYLRRLAQTPPEAAWWRRQEPLCAPPGSVGGLPETALLIMARFVEHVSLSSTLVASFFWPLHNVMLGVWMLIILYLTVLKGAWSIVMILVWGTRRTGISLNREWKDNLPLVAQSISAMNERHQALTSRLVGLFLLPFSTLLGFIQSRIPTMITLAASVWLVVMVSAWWYWFLVVPFCTACMLSTALASGSCFVLIEFAGV